MTGRHAVQRLALLFACALMTSIASATALDQLQAEVDAGVFSTAVRQANDYLKLHPGNRDARFLRARALAGTGKTRQAADAFQSLAEDFPLRPEPANNLAALYAAQGQYKKARDWLKKALATQPAYATAHRNLGDVYTALADLAYRKALGTDDIASKTPLTLLDRFYYAQESVAPGQTPIPAPKRASAPAPPVTDTSTTTPPPPPADVSRSVIQTVRAWATAWSAQDVDAYIDFYAGDFDPGDDMSRAQWRSLRQARLSRPDQIHIRIDSPSIEHIANDRVQVEFLQHYDSPRYSDQVEKRLLLTRTEAGWRILRETTLPRK